MGNNNIFIIKNMNTQGVKIKAVEFPLNQGTATQLSVLILNFTTDATTCSTYWQLLSDENKVLSEGNYTLTENEFSEWGKDNNFVNECVASAIGVVII